MRPLLPASRSDVPYLAEHFAAGERVIVRSPHSGVTPPFEGEAGTVVEIAVSSPYGVGIRLDGIGRETFWFRPGEISKDTKGYVA